MPLVELVETSHGATGFDRLNPRWRARGLRGFPVPLVELVETRPWVSGFDRLNPR
jgi:hypothetical protein